jgi:hypothetical protein
MILIFFGCSSGVDDNPKFHLEILPVEGIILPVEFKKDIVYMLPVSFIRPSTCHAFDGFYYESNLNIRTIAIQTRVLEQDNCKVASSIPVTQILEFKPTTETSYIFKLWKGKDASGVDIYEEITIPVIP